VKYRVEVRAQAFDEDSVVSARELLKRLLDAGIYTASIDVVPAAYKDGDLRCPDCPRIFATAQALGVHRRRSHSTHEAGRP
jgi:hypothetical protein